MTDKEWTECNSLNKMLEYLRDEVSDRKLRLFAVACCKRVWHLMTEERSRQAVEVAELFADMLVSAESLKAVADQAINASWMLQDERDGHWDCAKVGAADAALMAASCEIGNKVWGSADGYGAWEAALVALTCNADETVLIKETACFCDLLRDIFGNPFRPVAISSTWLTPTVVSLAQTIYAERAFDRMPILADALEEQGCDNADILTHCRSGGEHVRGCWVVDLVLGKK